MTLEIVAVPRPVELAMLPKMGWEVRAEGTKQGTGKWEQGHLPATVPPWEMKRKQNPIVSLLAWGGGIHSSQRELSPSSS